MPRVHSIMCESDTNPSTCTVTARLSTFQPGCPRRPQYCRNATHTCTRAAKPGRGRAAQSAQRVAPAQACPPGLLIKEASAFVKRHLRRKSMCFPGPDGKMGLYDCSHVCVVTGYVFDTYLAQDHNLCTPSQYLKLLRPRVNSTSIEPDTRILGKLLFLTIPEGYLWNDTAACSS